MNFDMETDCQTKLLYAPAIFITVFTIIISGLFLFGIIKLTIYGLDVFAYKRFIDFQNQNKHAEVKYILK